MQAHKHPLLLEISLVVVEIETCFKTFSLNPHAHCNSSLVITWFELCVAKPTDFEISYGYLESGETLNCTSCTPMNVFVFLLWRTADTIWSIHLWPHSWHVHMICTMFALVYACKYHEELHVYFSIVGSYNITLPMVHTCGRNSVVYYKHIIMFYYWASTEGAAHRTSYTHATTKSVWS